MIFKNYFEAMSSAISSLSSAAFSKSMFWIEMSILDSSSLVRVVFWFLSSFLK